MQTAADCLDTLLINMTNIYQTNWEKVNPALTVYILNYFPLFIKMYQGIDEKLKAKPT